MPQGAGGEWDNVLVDFADGGEFGTAPSSVGLTPPSPVPNAVICSGAARLRRNFREYVGRDQSRRGRRLRNRDGDGEPRSRLGPVLFLADNSELLPRHRQLREYWSALGIDVTSLRHLEYCERYTLVRGGATAELQYYYNGKNLLRRFGPTPGTRSDKGLLAEALSAFDALEDTGEREAPDEFVADFLKRLDASLEGSNIRRTSFKLMPYRLRVSFADGYRRGDIDFTFDGSKTWTAAQKSEDQAQAVGCTARSSARWTGLKN